MCCSPVRVSVDVDEFVTSIVEKRKISDLICVGGYGFSKASVFMRAFESLMEKNTKTLNEFYMSLIYEYLLKQQADAADNAAAAAPQSPSNSDSEESSARREAAIRNILLDKIIGQTGSSSSSSSHGTAAFCVLTSPLLPCAVALVCVCSPQPWALLVS